MNNTIWTSVDGGRRSFSAMDDSHLANILAHIRYYTNRYPTQLSYEVEQEIKRRNLSDEFLKGAPYPWRHKVTGIWYIWEFEKGDVVRVSGRKQKKVYAKRLNNRSIWFEKDKLYLIDKEYECGLFIGLICSNTKMSGNWKEIHNWERVEVEEYV